jgi:excisionase family DNA binding protein
MSREPRQGPGMASRTSTTIASPTSTNTQSSSTFDELPAVLTSKEAAQALRIGVKELRQLIDAGHLPAARLGPRRVIRVAKSAVLGVLNGTIRRTA